MKSEIWKSLFLLVWISSTFIFAVLIFVSGLLLHREELPYKSSCRSNNTTTHVFSSLENEKQQCFSSTLRVVLIIIDGLRYDFVDFTEIPKSQELPYQNKLSVVHEMLQKKPKRSRLFKSIADPPTATFPRIKALTTGSISTFIEVGSNFASSEIKEDNILDVLNRENESIVFMGDDTWESLYPNRFIRSYAFDSFNVWDLDSVDRGVEENLFLELQNNDWKLLVAHFLGVDHAGHHFGAIHNEMARKLNELNEIVRDVIEKLESQTNIVLFVIGDHGMTNSGDHGGDSEQEVSTVLFVYFPMNDLFESPVRVKSIHQVDIVPTLSTILGIPVPFSSTGSIILDCIPTTLLNSFSNVSFLLWRNVQQITNYIQKYSEHNSQFSSHQLESIMAHYTELKDNWQNDDLLLLIHNYENYMSDVLHICREVWVKFIENSIKLGITGLFLASLFAFFVSEIKVQVMLLINEEFFTIFTIGLISTTVLSIICAEFLSFDLTTTLLKTFVIVSILFMFWLCTKLKNSIISFLLNFRLKFVDVCLLVIYFVSLFVPFSNSFILEEPKIVLFLYVTSLWLITLNESLINVRRQSNLLSKPILVSICICVMYRIVITYAKCRPEEDHQCLIAEPSKINPSSCFLAVLSFICYIVFHDRVQRHSTISWILKIIGFLLSTYWLCETIVFNVGTELIFFNEIPRILLIFSTALIFYLYFNPVLKFILKKPASSSHKYTSIFDVSFSSIHTLLCITCVIILGQLNTVPAILMMIALWSSALHMNELCHEQTISWKNILLWGLSSTYWFYTTGHNASFPGIQWNAAFLIQKDIGSSTVLPGLLVVLNTFISQAMHGILLMLPLLSPFLNNLFETSGESERFFDLGNFHSKAFELLLKYFVFFSIRLTFVMLAVNSHRRHLMMWRVFAPKFIFESLAFVVILPFSIFGFLFFLRVLTRVKNL